MRMLRKLCETLGLGIFLIQLEVFYKILGEEGIRLNMAECAEGIVFLR